MKNENYRNVFFMITFLVLISAFSLIACGGGGGGGDGGGNPSGPNLQEGVFLDTAVEGIEYETATQSGVTDSSGTFKYNERETITFSIADVVLGQAAAKATMTPVDIVIGAVDEIGSTVTNICRLLQSLDEDGNLNNGITISAEIRNEVANRPIDFTQSTEDFGNDPDIETLFATLNALGIFTDEGDRTLCSAVKAQDHFEDTLVRIKQFTISDLEFPISVTRDSWVDGSVAYESEYEGAYEYIANPVMALRFYSGTTIITTYVNSPAPTVSHGRIYFEGSIPDDISGSGNTFFKLVDYDESADDNWEDSAVSNMLSQKVNIQ